jgi:hypothetical protein
MKSKIYNGFLRKKLLISASRINFCPEKSQSPEDLLMIGLMKYKKY